MNDRPLLFDFCGAHLLLESADPSLSGAFEAGFERFLVRELPSEAGAFRLRVMSGEPLVSSDLPLVWSGTLSEGGTARLFEDEERCTLLVVGACSLDIDIGAASAFVVVAPDGMARFMGSPSMTLLDFVLWGSGQHLLHAACLLNPRSGGAILVFGRSGRGKTSTAIALARGGFALMTDDASVLTESGGSRRAWGLPRGLKVHSRTAALMPWMERFLRGTWDAQDEQAVRLTEIEGQIALCAPEPRPLEAIVILGERAADHCLRRIAKGDILTAIAADNVPWYQTGMPRRARESFAALASAVAGVPTFQLNAGSDLAALPALFAASLN